MKLSNGAFHVGALIFFLSVSPGLIWAASDISEMISSNRVKADTVPMVKEDTLVSEAAPGKGHTTIEPTIKSDTLQAAVSRGNSLVNTGMFLHFFGLGISTIASIVSMAQRSNEDATAINLINLAALGLEITGPIFACAGASGVKDAAEKEGIASEPFTPWQDYGSGWAYTGIGTGMAIISFVIVAATYSTDKSGSTAITIPLLLGAVAFGIVGEVKWIQCLVHAKIYTNRYGDISKKRSLSLSVVPFVDMKCRVGLAFKGTF